MFLHQPFGDGEAESRSSLLTSFHLIEFIKDLLELICGNTHPCVPNFKKGIVFFRSSDDGDLPSLRRKLEGIREKVDKDVMESVPIGIEDKIIGDVDLDGEIFVHGFDFIDIRGGDLRKVDRLPMEAEMA